MEGNKELIKLAIWTVVIGGLFAFAWWRGWIKRISTYAEETREELRKCTWPSKNELKGSTVVIIIASLVLGFMIVAADFLITLAVTRFMMIL
ncbi:MAG: preprotein translocase subunit SecE [Verrucomicrobia bacterium]|nr:preprotein translocase subunit SecE [Verrucomicrobiota bacterium]